MHINRSKRLLGRIRGLMQRPETFIVAPEIARLSNEASELVDHCNETRTKHHELSCIEIVQHKKRIESLKIFIREGSPLNAVQFCHKMCHPT